MSEEKKVLNEKELNEVSGGIVVPIPNTDALADNIALHDKRPPIRPIPVQELAMRDSTMAQKEPIFKKGSKESLKRPRQLRVNFPIG